MDKIYRKKVQLLYTADSFIILKEDMETIILIAYSFLEITVTANSSNILCQIAIIMGVV